MNIQRIFAQSRITRALAYALAAMLVVTITVHRAEAASGDLDTHFGIGGVVTADLGGHEEASAVAVQQDGRIVIGVTRTYSPERPDFRLMRYNADGTLDTAFGRGGIAQTDFLGYGGAITSLKIDSQDRIVAAGYIYSSPQPSPYLDFAVARYTPSGLLDKTFGSLGKFTRDYGPFDKINAIAIQRDGKIVAGGYEGHFTIFRLTANGSPDLTFADGGIVLTYFSGAASETYAIALQSDGRIVAGGDVWDNDTVEFGLARYNTDGTLDTTFGWNGTVTTRILGDNHRLKALLIRPMPFTGEQIIAVGRLLDPDYSGYFAMSCYLSDGSLNQAYGAGGIVLRAFAEGGVDSECAVRQPDGKIIVAGCRQSHFGLTRYNGNGTLDTSFGNNGVVVSDSGDRVLGLALTPQAGIIAAGTRYFITGVHNQDIVIAKYLP